MDAHAHGQSLIVYSLVIFYLVLYARGRPEGAHCLGLAPIPSTYF